MLNRLQPKSAPADINEFVEAIKNGELCNVKNILDKGIDVNKRNTWGWYPLSVAAYKGHLNIVKLLLDAKAYSNTQDMIDGMSPLMSAATQGNSEIVTLLLDAGANLTISDKTGSTALHRAAGSGYTDIMRLLLKNKYINVNQKDKSGCTPLCTVSIYGKADEVTLLLTAGADPNVKANDGQTPLHIASCLGHLTAVRLLLQGGADPTIKKNDDSTPLQVAATGWEASKEAVVAAFKIFDLSQKLHLLFLQGIQLIKRGWPIDIFIEITSWVIERSSSKTRILFEKHQRHIPLKLFDVSMKQIEEKSANLSEKEVQERISAANLRLNNRMILT